MSNQEKQGDLPTVVGAVPLPGMMPPPDAAAMSGQAPPPAATSHHGPPPSYYSVQGNAPQGYSSPMPPPAPYPQQQGNPPTGYPGQGYPQTYPTVVPNAIVTSQVAAASSGSSTVVLVNSNTTKHWREIDQVNEWRNGLCSCCSNCSSCLCSCCCRCLVMGQNAEAVNQSYWLYCCAAFCPITSVVAQFFLRMEIRRKRRIRGSEMGDFCTIWWCSLCALTQERAELKAMAVEEQQMVRE